MFCRTLSGTAEEETKIPSAAGSCKPKPDRSARRRPMKMPAFWRKGRGTKKQTLADQSERERLTVFPPVFAHIHPSGKAGSVLLQLLRRQLDCAVGAAAGREYRAEPL